MTGGVRLRESELARPRKRAGSDRDTQEVTKGVARSTEIPTRDEDWHDIAKMLWDGMVASGQSDFFQQSDWAMAYSLCDDLSVYKDGTWSSTGIKRRSPEMLKALLSGFASLLVTEGDRRKAHIELEAPDPGHEPASVLAIADYRKVLELPPESESE